MLSLAFAIVAAGTIARSINRPIRELSRAARALGRDEPLAVPATDIREIEDLAKALISSAADAKAACQQVEKRARPLDLNMPEPVYVSRAPATTFVPRRKLKARWPRLL